ncbi:sensor histidine kinase [Poseidonibacter lekithochrous]|uniref:sensor histidine kinase n=1 Tax=Poseidonibacter lekithochrous TaxID=1904463 RepID=UPI002AF6A956|nr:sensor histidine kinase [Poseidonibacter lekithochrous]
MKRPTIKTFKINKHFLFLILFFIFYTSLHAEYQVSFFDDKTHYKDISQVLDKEFLPTSRKETFGKKKFLWLKVDITNKTNKIEDNYLSLRNIHIMKDVHFFTIKNNKVVKQNISFNKYKNPDVKHRIGNILLYNNEISPNEKIEVYIYMTAGSNIYYEINNGSLIEVMAKAAKSSAILVILTGILLALGIYYLFLYLFTPNKEYIYYTLLVTTMATWSFYVYGGYAYYFDLFSIGAFVNVLMVFLPMFTTLFFQSVYKDTLQFKNYNRILNVFVFILLIALVYEVLGRVGLYELKFKVTGYLAFIYIANLFTIFIIGLIIYFKKLPLSGLFLLAFSANFIGVIVTISFFRAKLPYTEITFYGNMIGSAIEAILFSILLTYKMRQVYKDKEDAINATKVQSIKINIMSETIDFISHQWRQPLSQINASVMAIEDITYKNNKNMYAQELDKELLHIENTTNYMSSTIDDFKNLFSTDKKEEVFLLNKILLNSISIVQKTFENQNICIKHHIEKELFIKGNKGDIAQTLLIIINNAKDVLIERKIENPIININLFSDEKTIKIHISDNAGGIKESVKDEVFNAYYTTKNKNEGSGLGLYIAKMIIENKMNGSLYIDNIENGSCFCIELQKENING